MLADNIVLNLKCQGVIEAYAEKYSVDLRKAFDVFYTSALYAQVRTGVSDMHCRSDKYLAEELSNELSSVGKSKGTQERKLEANKTMRSPAASDCAIP